MKKILWLLGVSLMSVLPVSANTIDFNQKGSILLELVEQEHNEKIADANIEIIKIADAKVDSNGNLYYEYVTSLNNCNVDIKDVTKINVNELTTCINDNTQRLSSISDNNGKVSFSNLDLGLYLIRQTNKLNKYTSIDSYLVTLPTIENNTWVYDIYSIPKTEIQKKMDITIIIEWKTEKDIKDKEITAELFNDNQKVNEYLITKDDNWTRSDTVLLSDKYSVKGETIDGLNISYVVEGNVFRIIYSDNLPQTGENLYITYILAFTGLIFIMLGVTLKKNEKNR